MSRWDDTLQYFTRMVGISDAHLDEVGDISADTLREIDELDLSNIRKGLKSDEAFEALDPSMQRKIFSLLSAFEIVSESLANHGTYLGLKISHILEVTAEGVTKIKVPYLNDAYRSWRGGLFREYKEALETIGHGHFSGTFEEFLTTVKKIPLPTDVEDGIDPLVVAYIRRSRNEDTLVSKFFRLILKENYDLPVKKEKIIQHARDGWGWLRYMTLPRLSTTKTLDDLADIANDAVQGGTKLNKSVDDAVDLINALTEAGRLDLPDTFMAFINSPNSRIKELLLSRIVDLLKKYAPSEGAEITAQGLSKLVGSGRNVPADQIIGEILIGFAYLYKKLEDVKIAYGLTDQQAEKVMEIFLQIEGVEDFFTRLLRQVDNDHAYIFEQLIPISIIAKALKQGIELDPSFIFIQSFIGSGQASDLLILVSKKVNGRDILVFLNIQMKSFLDLGSVIRNSSSGEALRQTTNSLDRMMREGVLQSGDRADIVGVTFHNIMQFKVNWNRLRLNPSAAKIAEIIEEMPTALQQRARDLDPSEFFAQTDELGDAIREAFHARYVLPVITSVNNTLRHYPNAWAQKFLQKSVKNADGSVTISKLTPDEVKKRIIDEFDLIKNPPSPSEWRYRYTGLVNLLDQGTPLANIETRLVTLFEEAFNLSDGRAIEITVDLVESTVKNDVTELL